MSFEESDLFGTNRFNQAKIALAAVKVSNNEKKIDQKPKKASQRL